MLDSPVQSNLCSTFSTGGAKELEELITVYEVSLFKYCYVMVRDYYETQEVVQDIFVKAYRKRHQYKNNTSLSAWLYKIAQTTCYDHLRKKKRRQQEHIKWELGEIAAPATNMSEKMELALNRLPPKDRALLFYRAVEEMDYGELAKMFHCTEAAVRKRYERAKKKLRISLEEKNGGETS